MLLNVDAELKRFMAENVADGEFESVAYYDEAGDFICVLMKDCSYYEESKAGDIFVVFRENNRPINMVGFAIERAWKLLQIVGLPQQGKLKLRDILKAISISAQFDNPCRMQAVELLAFLSLNECNDLEIEMPS